MRRIFVSLIGFLLALPTAAAPRLPAGSIAGVPFTSAVSAVVVGEVLFVAGYDADEDAGLAIYARDPENGAPAFVAALTHREMGMSQARALAASPDGRFLYLLGLDLQRQPAIGVFERLPDPALVHLVLIENFLLPELGGSVTRSLAISPDGRHLYVGTDRSIAICGLDAASGRPSWRGLREVGTFAKLLVSRDGESLYVAGDESLALRSFRRDPATGELALASTFHRFPAGGLLVNAGWDLAESPDGSYLYLLAADTDLTHLDGVLVFERRAGSQLQLLGRGPGWIENSPGTLRMTVNPRNGTLYLASYDIAVRLTAYPPRAAGAEFGAAADSVTDRPSFSVPGALAAGGEGDAVYLGSFDGLPLAAFATGGEAGALEPLMAAPPAVAGLAETKDFAVSPSGRLVLVAGAGGRIGRAGWQGGELRFLGHQRLAFDASVERIVFLDEKRFAVLLSLQDGQRLLQLYELAADGSAAALTGRLGVGTSTELWKSPDGRQLYLADRNVFLRFEYYAPAGLFIFHGQVGELGGHGPVRFSADGRRVLVVANQPAQVIPLYRTLQFSFDPSSGRLAAEPEDPDLAAAALDYAFSPDGEQLYVLKNGPDLDDLRVQVRRRATDGTFGVVAQQHILTSAATRIDSPAQLAIDFSGRELAVLGTGDGTLVHFARDPATGLLSEPESRPGAVTLPSHGFTENAGKIAYSSGSSTFWLLDAGASRLTASRQGCDSAVADELCLGAGGRFRVDADWQTADGRGAAKPVVTPSADSGLFYFFDPDNWEMLVKVLDGCAINGHYWLFAAATTDVSYTLRVADTISGQGKVYRNPLGTASPAITDTEALACPPEALAPQPAPRPAAAFEQTVMVLRNRFELRTSWLTLAGETGAARVVPFGAADSGLFYFFSDDNWEMLVKVLDGCAINGHFWVLAAASTDVGFTLEVKDRLAEGGSKLYTHPAGHAAPAILDLQALGGCAAPAEGER